MKVTKLFIDETIHNDAKSLEVSVMDNEVIAVGEVEMASSEIKSEFGIEKFKRIWLSNGQVWYIKA